MTDLDRNSSVEMERGRQRAVLFLQISREAGSMSDDALVLVRELVTSLRSLPSFDDLRRVVVYAQALATWYDV